ncbi:MAG: DUF1269 domain-containing protein [Anaerolineae bacterium]|nr:DUF1269 domain-containing protein [Anaerolineae bacterium]
MASKLVALTFDESNEFQDDSKQGLNYAFLSGDPEAALLVLKEIEQKAKETNANLEDAVIIYKTGAGEIRIKQTREVTPGKGARRGAFWGMLAGVLFGGPLVGALWGLGIGAVYGRAVDKGVNEKFIKDVSQAIKPGRSALLLLIGEEDYDRAIPYLKTFDTRIYEADLDESVEEAVEKAVENPDVAKAAEEEFLGQ